MTLCNGKGCRNKAAWRALVRFNDRRGRPQIMTSEWSCCEECKPDFVAFCRRSLQMCERLLVEQVGERLAHLVVTGEIELVPSQMFNSFEGAVSIMSARDGRTTLN